MPLRLIFLTLLAAVTSAGAALLSSVVPNLGDTHGGAQLTLRGLRFTGATSVTIGGTPCIGMVVVNDRLVTCLAPAKSPGLHPVAITSPKGTSTLIGAYESWSPSALPGARVYQADQGISATEEPAAGSWHPWTRTTASISPAFKPRDGAQLLHLNGALYLLGGMGHVTGSFSGQDTTNEVWKSTNGGVTWKLILPHNNNVDWLTGNRWRRRHMMAVAVHNGLLYVMGGDVSDTGLGGKTWPTYPTDVWSSPDGVVWTRRTSFAAWGPRALHMGASFNGKLYVMGGQRDCYDASTVLNDVWESSDGGTTWNLVTPAAGWAGRGMVTSPVVFNNHLYLAGGGTYTDTVPRTFYNDVWRWSGTGDWELVTPAAAWPGREYHNVVAYDNKLWVIGGYCAAFGNMNDVWSSPDGIAWAQNHETPWDYSHADGVAVGDGRLYHGPGNGSMQRPFRRDFWHLTPRPGLPVSEWRDLGADARHLAQSDPTDRPFLFESSFGAQPGIDFKGVHHLLLSEVDRDIGPSAFQIYFIGKTTHQDLKSDVENINPPSTLVGNTLFETHNEFGLRAGVLRYHDGAKGWIKTERSGGLNDGRCRLLWLQHQNKSVRMGVGTYAIGPADTRAGFHPVYTGWNSLGAGYGAADRARFTIGALVVIKGPVLPAAQLKKLNTWAKKWGSISP